MIALKTERHGANVKNHAFVLLPVAIPREREAPPVGELDVDVSGDRRLRDSHRRTHNCKSGSSCQLLIASSLVG